MFRFGLSYGAQRQHKQHLALSLSPQTKYIEDALPHPESHPPCGLPPLQRAIDSCGIRRYLLHTNLEHFLRPPDCPRLSIENSRVRPQISPLLLTMH